MFAKLRFKSIPKSEQHVLLELARNSIAAKLFGTEIPQFGDLSHRLIENRGVFVSLKKNDKLRGCIGFIHGVKPLYQMVQDVAESAAFRDPRFPPLTKEELSEVKIEISVMTPLHKVPSPRKIKVRQHGVLIKHGEAQGLLLPQVAERNKWDRKALLENVCLKAGLEKRAWQDPEAELMVFEAQVFEEQPLGD